MSQTLLARLLAVLLFAALPTAVHAANADIASKTATVDGLKLQYLTGGHGPALVLLHGYAETSRMWRPLFPRLAEKFTIVAPDLPGIGGSDIPASGLDMKSSAIRIHALVRSLGIEKARVVGHDIGLMVAYAYAALYPAEVERLVLMDAFLPGVGEWESVYNSPSIWHFRFNGETPEQLVKGRERIYFEHFWNNFAADRTRSIPEADRAAYAQAYAGPGRMRAGFAYFVSFLQAARDFSELARTRLTMPVLTIGGRKSLGEFLARQIPLVGTDVRSVVLENAGHWVTEEDPKGTTDALASFLTGAEAEARPAAKPPADTSKRVFSEALPNVPGQTLTAVVVDYAPGAKSERHRHAGSVFVYVLSGAIRSECSATGPARVYKAGETFFEPPGSIHLVSENASDTEPASLLAVFVAENGARLSTPDEAPRD